MKLLKPCLFEPVLLLSFQNNIFRVQMSVLVYFQMLSFLCFIITLKPYVHFLLEHFYFKTIHI